MNFVVNVYLWSKSLLYFQMQTPAHNNGRKQSVDMRQALGICISVGILLYVQQDATLHSLFYLETALHVSGGTITHHQERKQLYLQHLVFITPLLLSAAIAYAAHSTLKPVIL